LQFAQHNNYLKLTTGNATQGATVDIATLEGANGVTSITYSGISLILNTLNYIPLEKPITFSYYNTQIEKSTIKTKINELDLVSDKSLLQVFF